MKKTFRFLLFVLLVSMTYNTLAQADEKKKKKKGCGDVIKSCPDDATWNEEQCACVLKGAEIVEKSTGGGCAGCVTPHIREVNIRYQEATAPREVIQVKTLEHLSPEVVRRKLPKRIIACKKINVASATVITPLAKAVTEYPTPGKERQMWCLRRK